MMKVIEFKAHPDHNARGRNGWFTPQTAFITNWEGDEMVDVAVESGRAAKCAPLHLSLCIEDAENLANTMLAACKDARERMA